MKTLFTILTLLCLYNITIANRHNVAVSSYQFSPSTFTAAVGDTVAWTVSGSIPHTTTSTSVPAGAAMWNSGTLTPGTPYIYVITTAGIYDYQCNFHAVSNNMVASFTATGTSLSITPVSEAPKLVIPSPFNGTVMVNYDKPSSIMLFNILGQKIAMSNLHAINGMEEINFSSLQPGMYIVLLANENAIIETRRVIKQ